MSATLRLYECTDDLLTVREWLDEQADAIKAAGGECPPELAELLDMADGDFREKAERVALFVRELIATSKAEREEARRLLDRADHHERSAESLKQYLLLNMQRAEMKKVEGKLVTIRVQASPASVESVLTLPEIAALPDKFARRVMTVTLDKRAVIEAEALGEPIPAGVSIVRGFHVRLG